MSTKKERPRLQMGPLTGSTGPGTLMAGFTSPPVPEAQTDLPLSAIRPRPQQPRRSFAADPLARLTDSIRSHGILQPLSVHQTESGYDLISGERRLRAARAAGLTSVPVKVFSGLTDRQVQQLSAVENLQREDLNPVDEADAVLDILAAELDIPKGELTPRLERWKSMRMRDPALGRATEDERQAIVRLEALFRGLSRGEWTSFVANRLPVLRLPEALLEAVREGRLEYTKAIALKRAPEGLREALLAEAGDLSVQQLRQRIQDASRTVSAHDELDTALETFQRLISKERLATLSPQTHAKLLGLIKQAVTVVGESSRSSSPGRAQ
ncbi:ParB/RepB/Spo0J family partition protein [Deinococcus sp. Arct2-2]|uniref:ParB/RepB/Spo0J family partition protein n=1 Tax=Deinococcus sp. Arct2-2 TaxID=2568653 RepID=UPI0010A3D4C5|nr:ParB/RepB/Spo0J family partition protein [Deinococcus sp. Arct2-2]THF70395.1 ParB/RepB/Spo0J family partition protein [Deinococcus sp. Arct2-2]